MISKQHGGVARSVAASQLLNPRIDPELRSVCAESHYFQVLWFSPTSHKYIVG